MLYLKFMLYLVGTLQEATDKVGMEVESRLKVEDQGSPCRLNGDAP